ncbi:MAG TPA: DUF6603 domain-containing protein [Pyrinomonadaceae bacterium]|jgi:hypothetical protein
MASIVNESAAGIGDLLSFLTKIHDDVSEAKAFINLMGWELPPGVEDVGLATLDLGDFLEKLDAVLGASDEEWENEVAMLTRVGELILAINTLVQTLIELAEELPTKLAAFGDYVDRTNIHRELPKRLFDFLLANYLAQTSPLGFALLHLINVIDYPHFPADPENFQVEHVRATINYRNFKTLVTDPSQLAEEAYGWNTERFLPMTFLLRLSLLFQALGMRSRIQPLKAEAEEVWLERTVTETEPLPQLITFLHEERGDIAGLRLGFSVFGARPTSAGATDGGLGLAPIVRGQARASVPFFKLDDTFIDLSAEGDLLKRVALILRPNEDLAVRLGNGLSDTITGRFSLSMRRGSPDAEPKHILSFFPGAALRLQQFIVTGGLEKYSDRSAESFMELALLGGSIDFSLDDADDFLQESIKQDSVASPFDLRVGWTSEQGIYFQGSSGLTVSIPVHARLGAFTLNSLTVGLKVEDEGLDFEASVAGNLSLGPLLVTVKGVGLKVDVSFGEGNLGIFGLQPRFKPPSGLGLSIDGGGFKGGGFMDFEPEDESYSGILELDYQGKFSLKAFGLLTTRLPNGQDGFSLIIIINSEFTPIQLGFGFKLNGVGGLLGLNRTVKTEVLRAGLRDNTLGSILFPTNIIANSDRILSDLRQVFPPESRRFVFGPMAKITWGTPTLITADLGLVIEIPEPVRLVILGVVRAHLPDEKSSILRLQVNFLGEINFEQERLSFDASLFDSKLLAFALTGDMALRLYWGKKDANFLLTVGGFHPAYQPPPMNLPALRRLTLALVQGDNPRLTLQLYFAVTANTVQFGARLELYASAWKFNVYGFLSFDVLFQFNPFYFIAEITAILALRVGSSSIASIKLTFALEGPAPWKARGTASFKVCWFFTLKIRFNKTFGETRNTSLPDIAVLPLLVEALSAPDNWEAELPERKRRLESFKEASDAADQLLVHPLGTLKVSQKVVPLNLRIDRMGSQRPGDAREFRITEIQLPGRTINNAQPAQESFAPAQFFDMSDEEKLASPSFRNFDSGVRVGEPERLHTAYAAARAVTYELKYIDSQRERRLAPHGNPFEVDNVAFNAWAVQGAIAKSELSFARGRKSNLAPEEVSVAQEPFAVVTTGDLKLFDQSSLLASEREALTRINALIEQNPALRGKLQAVPAFEMSP